jgi:hypothetical protein
VRFSLRRFIYDFIIAAVEVFEIASGTHLCEWTPSGSTGSPAS